METLIFKASLFPIKYSIFQIMTLSITLIVFKIDFFFKLRNLLIIFNKNLKNNKIYLLLAELFNRV